ncbi:MAG: hypothetical protein BAJALOKI1v1_370007 [Promethearchaeota archaeon]|nr:MAG: hypothetical protein BAJALOKI1v1_370007 [Candidatus Lokiarchaeota archaeon]
MAISHIALLAVVGTKNGREYEFIKEVYWQQKYPESELLLNRSLIEFIGISPDKYTLITIYYNLTFDFGPNYYANITLGYSNNLNESSIKLEFEKGFLPPSNKSLIPMYTQFIQECDATGSQTEFVLDYGLEGITEWNDEHFILYNEQELNSTVGEFTTSIQNNYPRLTFNNAPTNDFSVIYGIRSQYALGYGFQKVNQSYSDSVRLLSNDYSNPHIINDESEPLATTRVEEPALYIDLDGINESIQLLTEDVPLLHAPELNFSFVFDEILMDYMDTFSGELPVLDITFTFIPTNARDVSFTAPSEQIGLNSTEISSYYQSGENNSYNVNFAKHFPEIYELFGTISVDVYIDIAQ